MNARDVLKKKIQDSLTAFKARETTAPVSVGTGKSAYDDFVSKLAGKTDVKGTAKMVSQDVKDQQTTGEKQKAKAWNDVDAIRTITGNAQTRMDERNAGVYDTVEHTQTPKLWSDAFLQSMISDAKAKQGALKDKRTAAYAQAEANAAPGMRTLADLMKQNYEGREVPAEDLLAVNRAYNKDNRAWDELTQQEKYDLQELYGSLRTTSPELLKEYLIDEDDDWKNWDADWRNYENMLAVWEPEAKRREGSKYGAAMAGAADVTPSEYKPQYGSFDEWFEENKPTWWTGDNTPKPTKENGGLYAYVNDPDFAMKYEYSTGKPKASAYWENGYAFLTENERRTYNALYDYDEKNGTNRAQAFLEDITTELKERRAEYDDKLTRYGATETWMAPGYYAAARFTNLANSLMTPVQAAYTLMGGTDTNGALYQGNRFVNSVNAAQGEKMGEMLDWVNPLTGNAIGSDLYNWVTSTADSAASIAVGGLWGKGTKAAQVVTQLIMSSNAASNELMEQIERGRTGWQAIVPALASGAVEAVTEKYSLDALWEDPKNYAKYLLKNIVTEGSEEGASTLLNYGVDEIYSRLIGDDSKQQIEYIKKLYETGDEKAAAEYARNNFLQGLVSDVLGGMVSGGLMGGYSAAADAKQNRTTGKKVKANNEVQALVDLAKGMGNGSESYEIVKGLKGKEPSLGQVGRLWRTTIMEINEHLDNVKAQATDDLMAANRDAQSDYEAAVTDAAAEVVAEHMAEMGETLEGEELRQAAVAILEGAAQMAQGRELTQEQMEIIAGTDTGSQVLEAMMDMKDATDEQKAHEQKWYAKMEERRAEAEKAANEKLVRRMAEATVDTQEQVRQVQEKLDRVLGMTSEETRAASKTITAAKKKSEGMVTARGKGRMSVLKKGLLNGMSVEFEEMGAGGRVVVRTEDGKTKTVDAADLQLDSQGVAEVIAYAADAREDMGRESMQTLVDNYKGGDADTYLAEAQSAWDAGFDGKAMPEGLGISQGQTEAMYKAGQADARQMETSRRQNAQRRAVSKGRLTFAEGIDREGLVDTQKHALDVLERLAEATGISFEIFESRTDESGEYTSENGSWNPKTNSIRLDLNADRTKANAARYGLIRTAAHEMTHYIEGNTQGGYEQMVTFIKGEYARRGQDFSALVTAKMAQQGIGRREATGEVIADACEMMLQQTDIVNRLAKQNNSLYQRIKGWLHDFAAKIKKAFQGIDPQRDESRAIMDYAGGMWRYTQEMVDAWDNALEEAVWANAARENAEAVRGETVVQRMTAEEYREALAREASDVDTKFSLREEEPPKNVIIAYKAFYARDGKLYPPMIANATDESSKQKVKNATTGTMKSLETPVGVWLNADVGGLAIDENGKPMRAPSTGRLKVQNDKGGGTLAFRPGWHLGEWPDAKQFDKLNKETGLRDLMPDDLVFAKCEIAADVDYQLDALAYGIKANGKYDRTQAGLPMVPTDGYYKYRTNPDPNTAPWYITGAMRVTEILDDDMAAEICAQYGVVPDKRFSGKKIDLAKYGLKAGPVEVTPELQRFVKNQRSKDNDVLLNDALNDPEYRDAYVKREINFDDTEIAKEFERNGQDVNEYREKYRAAAYNSDAMKDAAMANDEEGKPLLSVRSMTEDKDEYRRLLTSAGIMNTREIDSLFKTIDAVIDRAMEDRGILDFGEDISKDERSFRPLKNNSDPLYKVSLDFSSLCRKRLLQMAVQEAIETRNNVVMTSSQRIAVRNALKVMQQQGAQIEVACALCYVESARLKNANEIQRFMDDKTFFVRDYFAKKNKAYMKQVDRLADRYAVEVLGYKPGTAKKNMKTADKTALTNYKQDLYTKYQMTQAEQAIADEAERIPEDMYKTADGLWKLRAEHKEIFDAYTTRIRNATKSKGIETDTPFYLGDTGWNGRGGKDVVKASAALIKRMNDENGLRMQSWSDFQVKHILDYMGAMMELSMRGAKVQTYTKVPGFVKLMGNTGTMINLSLIPTDYNGQQVGYDPVEGMDYETAMQLRKDYPATVGNICIAMSPEHLVALLRDNDIDYVIPYHASSLNHQAKVQMGLKAWFNFEDYQNEKEQDHDTTEHGRDYHKAIRFSDWFNYEDAAALQAQYQQEAPKGDKTYGARKAMQIMAQRYIELCHRRGYTEKFADWSGEENYWKLLIDRKMINQETGEIIEQKPVTPTFNRQDILALMDEEVRDFTDRQGDEQKAIEQLVQMWSEGKVQDAAMLETEAEQLRKFEDEIAVANIAGMEEQKKLQRRESSTDVREYVANLTEADMYTETEKSLLRIYQKALAEHQTAANVLADALKARDAAQNADEAKALDAKVKTARSNLAKATRKLNSYERSEGFVNTFSRAREVVGRYIGNANRESIEQALEDRQAEIRKVEEQLKAAQKILRDKRDSAAVTVAMSLFKAKDMAEAVAQVKQSYPTRMTNKELEARLSLIYAAFATGSDSTVYGEVEKLADEIMAQRKAQMAEGSPISIWKESVSRFSLTDNQKQEAKKAGWSESDIRKALPGMYAPKSNTNLDQAWAEAATQYPGIFDPDMNEGDMLSALMDMARTSEAQDEGTQKEMKDSVMVSILTAMPTQIIEESGGAALKRLRRYIVDNAEGNAQVANALEKLETQMQKSRAAENAALARLRGDVTAAREAVEYFRAQAEATDALRRKEDMEAITRQLRSEATQKAIEEREAREITERNAKNRRRIERMVRSMGKRLHSEKSSDLVLEQYRPAAELMLKAFADIGSNAAFTPAQAEAMSQVYENMLRQDTENGLVLDEDIREDLDSIVTLLRADVENGKAGNGMSPREKAAARVQILEDLAEVVQHFNAVISNAGTMFVNGKRVMREEIAASAAEQMREHGPKRMLAGNAAKGARAIDNFIRVGNMTPYYFFKQLNNTEVQALWEDIRAAQNEYGLRLAQAQETVQGIKEQYHYNDWDMNKRIQFVSAQGRMLDMDIETAMQIWATWKREGNSDPLITSRHLEEGGFIHSQENAPTYKDGKRTYVENQRSGNKITAADIKKLESMLTDEQKAYTDAIVDFLSTTVGEWGNETTMEQLGIRKYKEKYYIPMQVAGDALTKMSTEGADPENRGKTERRHRLISPKFGKRRVNQAMKPLVMRGLTSVAAEHINAMATYSTFAIPIESLNGMLNTQSDTKDGSMQTMRQLFGETYGEEQKGYLENLIRDMNGGAITDPAERGMNKMVSLFKKGAVYGSMSVAMQQPLSYIRAAAVMNPKYLGKALATDAKGILKDAYEEAKRWSGIAVIKEVGRVDMGLGMSAVEYLADDGAKAMDKWAETARNIRSRNGLEAYESFRDGVDKAFGFLPGKMDEITWGRIWTACKLEIAETRTDLAQGSDEYFEAVARRFADVIDATQVYDSTLTRSANMRSNSGLMKMVTSFMAEPTVTANMLYDAFANQKGAKPKAIAIATFVAAAIAQAIVKGAFTAGRRDDEDKTFAEKWAAGFTSNLASEINPLGLLPFVRDIVSLLEGSDVDRADLSVVNEFITAVNKIGNDNVSAYRKVEDIAGALAKFAGLPVKNAMRDLRTAWNWMAGNAKRETNSAVMSESLKAGMLGMINLEGIGWSSYDTSRKAYYSRIADAMAEGRGDLVMYYRDYLKIGAGVTDKAIDSGVKTQIKERMLAGTITEDKAMTVLKGIGMTETDAYWQLKEWRDTRENAGSEDYAYKKYADFENAVRTGEKLAGVIDDYTANGVKKETLASQITSLFKAELIELYTTDKKAAAALQARLLTAYEALGYDRDKKLKDIQKWYK